MHSIQVGQSVTILSGAFKGSMATILSINDYTINAEVIMFGRKTPVELSWDDIGLEKNSLQSMSELIKEFDAVYKQAAPLRYERLLPGYTSSDMKEKLRVEDLPEDYQLLYQWRNGLSYSEKGWKDEFLKDSWYEVAPLYGGSGWESIDDTVSTISMWENIMNEQKQRQQPCYWKPGFIPFLRQQNFGWMVLDTVGYFGGVSGQIIAFDYKCANGYTIKYQSMAHWLFTITMLVKEGALREEHETDRMTKIENHINGGYIRQFRREQLELM
jgi:cell wall assembly regulator SMI1